MGLGNFLGSPQQRSLLDGFWERVTLKEVSFLEVDTTAGGGGRGYLGKLVTFLEGDQTASGFYLVKFEKGPCLQIRAFSFS